MHLRKETYIALGRSMIFEQKDGCRLSFVTIWEKPLLNVVACIQVSEKSIAVQGARGEGKGSVNVLRFPNDKLSASQLAEREGKKILFPYTDKA